LWRAGPISDLTSCRLLRAWDGRAVRTLMVSPLLLTWLADAGRAMLLAPFAGLADGRVRDVWRRHRREVVLVAILSPLAYLLVLLAFVVAPISMVAPSREVSVLIGAVLGIHVLGEPKAVRRVTAAAFMAAGIMSISLAG
jgi:uncharacterized membrane protein